MEQGYSDLQIIVLAAGEGTRMRSKTPKVLHRVLGRPLLEHVLHAVEQLSPRAIAVVVGRGADEVRAALGDPANVDWVLQRERRGTAHAVLAAQAAVAPDARDALIVCGDTPLLRPSTLASLIKARRREDADVAMLTAEPADPSGYGRVVRDASGRVAAVVEEKDATASERAIREVNAGVFCVRLPQLFDWLAKIDDRNAQKEFYLPEIVRIVCEEGGKVIAHRLDDATEMLGVNDRAQLAEVEAILQQQVIRDWQRQGVTIEQPHTVRIELGVSIGEDVVIHAGCQLLGQTHIGDDCEIGPYAVIRDVWLDDGVRVAPFSVLEGPETEVAQGARIGPFARLRPGTRLGEEVRIGNFVEVKNSVLGRGTKANHLSYLGDAEIGEDCNIGAGTITCNYDGANKHKTIIEDDVFVGSDTKLIAPIRVGKGATIGAGSILTRDVPAGGLTLTARPETIHRPGWRRPRKGKK